MADTYQECLVLARQITMAHRWFETCPVAEKWPWFCIVDEMVAKQREELEAGLRKLGEDAIAERVRELGDPENGWPVSRDKVWEEVARDIAK